MFFFFKLVLIYLFIKNTVLIVIAYSVVRFRSQ